MKVYKIVLWAIRAVMIAITIWNVQAWINSYLNTPAFSVAKTSISWVPADMRAEDRFVHSDVRIGFILSEEPKVEVPVAGIYPKDEWHDFRYVINSHAILFDNTTLVVNWQRDIHKESIIRILILMISAIMLFLSWYKKDEKSGTSG